MSVASLLGKREDPSPGSRGGCPPRPCLPGDPAQPHTLIHYFYFPCHAGSVLTLVKH